MASTPAEKICDRGRGTRRLSRYRPMCSRRSHHERGEHRPRRRRYTASRPTTRPSRWPTTPLTLTLPRERGREGKGPPPIPKAATSAATWRVAGALELRHRQHQRGHRLGQIHWRDRAVRRHEGERYRPVVRLVGGPGGQVIRPARPTTPLGRPRCCGSRRGRRRAG